MNKLGLYINLHFTTLKYRSLALKASYIFIINQEHANLDFIFGFSIYFTGY